MGLSAVLLARHGPASAARTYGWHRAEVFTAVANAVLLIGVATFILTEAIRRIGAGRAALASMMGPLLTIGFGWWLLHESVSLEQIVGALLVVCGILVVSQKK